MIDHVLAHVAPAAYALLPPTMQSPGASALLLAIGLQESRFIERRQLGGPARGFWQFEEGGVRGVLDHHASAGIISNVLAQLAYPKILHPSAAVTLRHLAIEHNDTLAFCFARCLLWTLPEALPGPEDVELGWQQYVVAWNPGAARGAREQASRERWSANYRQAWALVTQSPENIE